jgi:hypothetical protein
VTFQNKEFYREENFSVKKLILPLSVIAIMAASTSCNIFSPVDHPGNDAQYISAARACFDDGNIQCALDNYAKVTGGDKEIAIAETAFAMLDQAGVTMADFMGAMSNGDASKGLATLAGHLSTLTTGKDMRAAMFAAYLKVNEITINPEIRGLVRFMAAFAIAAEILAEDVGPNHILEKTDYVTSLTCTAVNCTKPASASIDATGTVYNANDLTGLGTGGTDLNTTTIKDAANWCMFNWAMKAIDTGTGVNEMGASGQFGSGTNGFASTIGAKSCNIYAQYAYGLLFQGLGQ